MKHSLLTLGVLILLPACARADFVVSVTGVNKETGATVSAMADFSVSGDTLTIVLTNTTGNTINRGDVLTGLLFNVNANPSPTLDLKTIALTSGSVLYTSKTTTTTSANLNGSWTDELSGKNPFGIGASGFNGVFMAGTLTQGNGGTDFGIIGKNTTFQNGFSASAFPLINNSITFSFSGASGITEAMFTDIEFLFGTSGAGVLTATPAPSGLLLGFVGFGALGLAAVWGRKNRSASHAA